MQWEYHIMALVGDIDEKFNDLGLAGWELVAVIPHAENISQAVFKRRKES